MQFPREIGLKRSQCSSRSEFDKYVNRLNGKSNIYTSLYRFKRPHPTMAWKYDPESVVMDRAWWDFDITNDTTRKKQCYWQMIRTLKKNDNDPSLEAQLYLKAVSLYDENYKYLASLLNSFAWRMTEIGQLLPEALEKVNYALEIKEDLKILDTKAEVLWKLGRVEEAIKVINECIQGNPEYKHYQDQKAKFLATKAL